MDRARPILPPADGGDGGNRQPRHPRAKTHVLFVSQVESHASIRAFFPPGTLSPMHASGIGKALLAQMTDDRLSRYIATAPPRPVPTGPHADRSGRSARRPSRKLRARGYALDDEEKTEGMRCIAAAVFDWTGEAGGGPVGIGPGAGRISALKMPLLAEAVARAAAELTAALGAEARG